jgi:hypothetical protein
MAGTAQRVAAGGDRWSPRSGISCARTSAGTKRNVRNIPMCARMWVAASAGEQSPGGRTAGRQAERGRTPARSRSVTSGSENRSTAASARARASYRRHRCPVSLAGVGVNCDVPRPRSVIGPHTSWLMPAPDSGSRRLGPVMASVPDRKTAGPSSRFISRPRCSVGGASQLLCGANRCAPARVRVSSSRGPFYPSGQRRKQALQRVSN